jgi:hypothetical protein
MAVDMKKTQYLAFSLVLILAVVVLMKPASAQINVAVLDVSLVSQNPYPAEPGSNVNIEIEIENTGSSEANNVVVEIVPKSPFTLLPGEESKKSFNRIGAQSSVKDTYDLYVDSNAISNDYTIDFRIYSASNPSTYSTRTIKVSVQGNPKLILESVETTPKDMEPGGSVTLDFNIRNIGSGTARQLQARINSTSAYLVPILSGGLVYIGDLKPGESKEATTRLSIDSLAEYKTYITTLTLEYKDESNTRASDTFSVGIPITGSIMLDIIKIEPNYARNLLYIEIANKGTTDSKSLEAKLVMGNLTIGVDYISQLKATKKTTLSFPLVTEGQARLIIDYVGPGLEQSQIVKEITMNFEPPSGDGTATYVLIIIVLVIAYLAWRKFFRKKHHHSSHRSHK